MAYTTVVRMRRRIGNMDENEILDVEIEDTIEKADALIDAYLSGTYIVPVTATASANLLRSLSEEIGLFYLVRDQIPRGFMPQGWDIIHAAFEEARRMLSKIAKGDLSLPGATALATADSPVWGSTVGQLPAFDIDHETNWGVDNDRIDDIKDERDAVGGSILPRDGI